ncbi:hypothetical protein CBS101457_004526 [Exobasidium rhododendri]|nr:hypothetical protein CBS101457_004526 [Exobasidium rhododendri]
MASAAITAWAQPYCTKGGFPHLAPFVPNVLQSLSIWVGLQILSNRISPKIFPQTWAHMKPASRASWNIHWVALVHAVIITPLTARIWWNVYQQGGMGGTHILGKDRLYGFDQEAGSVYAIALGYFIWDAVVSAMYDGPAFVAHGLVAMTAFIFVYHPIFMYDGLGFLLWELSTPFLNIHWFLDKLGKTGSKMQLVNAVFLLSTYVLARLTFGVYNSLSFMSFVYFPSKPHYPPIPTHIKIFYTVGNLTLNTLNFIWFKAMIRAVQKRFAPVDPQGAKLDAKKIATGKQSVKAGVRGSHDEPFEKQAGVGNHDYSSHGSYSDSESREARWRQLSKKEAVQ